jgi:hypothetical protein
VVSDWVNPESEVTCTQNTFQVPGGQIQCAIYEFGKVGRVIHLVPSVGAREEVDEMFYKYQTQDILFRRYRRPNGRGRSNFYVLLMVVEGGKLGQQFMHNAGAPYTFILENFSQPLEEAAPVISEVLDFLKKRVNLIVPCNFNEVLSVTYMEGQKMTVCLSFTNRSDS